jgi:YVTN family beta-propeller protein
MRLYRFILSAVLLSATLAATTSNLRQIGMVNVPGVPGFGELAFANGMLLMTHTGAATLDVFDPVRRRIVAQVTGLQSPRALAVDEPNGKVYVADHGSMSIAVVAIDGWRVVDSIPLQGAPDALLLDASNGRLYWADADKGTVSVVDVKTKQNVATVDIGGTPRTLALADNGSMVFVTVQDLHQVLCLDSQLKIVKRFDLNASQPTGLVYDPQYHELYVSVRYAVLAISADTGAEIDRVPAPSGVDALWLDPGSRTLYAASDGSLLLMQAKGRLVASDEIPTDVKGHTVAYDAPKRLVLLPGGREGKSKILILRPMNSTQPDAADDERAGVR